MNFQEVIEACAKAAHETNRAFAALQGDQQPSWEDSTEEIRESSRKGVQKVLANPTITAEDLHAEWMSEKAKSGWKHGQVKDEKAKTHPSMVPFDQLPGPEKFKDELFRTVVREGALAYLSTQAKRVAFRQWLRSTLV